MAQGAENPKVGDTLFVGERRFEIRAIIAEESNVLLNEADVESARREIWILRRPTLVRREEGVWQATQYESFEKADESEGEEP